LESARAFTPCSRGTDGWKQESLESEVGAGNVFRFTVAVGLPALEEDSPPVPGERRGSAEPEEGLRVIVAEDNPVNQLFARELLERLGHGVVAVSDGEEALRSLQRERFDVILMDVQMPALAGDEAARRIRAGLVEGCPPDLPIVALTAHALEGDRERFLAAGMNDYLSKPFGRDALKDVLRRVTPKAGN
jgi:CheY-like chemotaxis protein